MNKNLTVMIGLFLFAVAGCNGTNYHYTNLTGQVSLDGTVLTEGSLMFYPKESGNGKGVFVHIGNDNHYKAEKVPLGKIQVTITAMKKSGKKITVFDQEMDEFVSVIPERYKGGIEVEIIAGQKELNIELNSKPKEE